MTDEEAAVIEQACAVVEAFYTQDPGLPTALFLAKLDALHAVNGTWSSASTRAPRAGGRSQGQRRIAC
jgi:predicted membrane-bound mannosyltransferase